MQGSAVKKKPAPARARVKKKTRTGLLVGLSRVPMNRVREAIEKLVKDRKAEVQAVVRRFRKLRPGERRSYGPAALFFIAALEQALKKKK